MNQSSLLQKGLRLEYLTLGWNIVGCVVVLIAAHRASSLALFGFGIDSVIEIFASVVVVWQLKAINKEKERAAVRLIGVAFVLLAAYLAIQSVLAVAHHAHPASSPLGILWLTVTAAAMFALAYGKKRVGEQLGNPVLIAESNVTVIDGLLAVSVLAGLLLNTVFALWWADSLASLGIVYYGIREAIHAFK